MPSAASLLCWFLILAVAWIEVLFLKGLHDYVNLFDFFESYFIPLSRMFLRGFSLALPSPFDFLTFHNQSSFIA